MIAYYNFIDSNTNMYHIAVGKFAKTIQNF